MIIIDSDVKREAQRAANLSKLTEGINEKPARVLAKAFLVPGYIARMGLNLPSNAENRRRSIAICLIAEVGRDALFYATPLYKTIEYLVN